MFALRRWRPLSFWLVPDPEQCIGRIDQGFDHLMFSLPSEPADKVLPLLDRVKGVIDGVRG